LQGPLATIVSIPRKQRDVALPLMIPLCMVMLDKSTALFSGKNQENRIGILEHMAMRGHPIEIHIARN
jgi:hypothetical protein